MKKIDPQLAVEAKSIVALAFRNGPIEDVHAGKTCTACAGNPEFSHITDDEMKSIMKAAVNAMYKLLWAREHDRETYCKQMRLAERYTSRWDDPNISNWNTAQ